MVNVDVLKGLNWEKRLNGDEREVCHTQAALFELCQNKLNCDAFDFVNKFMYSEIAVDMDNEPPDYYDVDPFQMLYELPYILPLLPLTEEKSTTALHWIGYFYRYWALMGTSSRDIIKFVPVENAYAAYTCLHTLDVREVISMFVERA